MVQQAIGASPTGSGFYASVADATSASVSDFNDYRVALRNASEALAEFYDTCRNEGGGGPGVMAESLQEVLDSSSPTSGVRLEIEGLIKSMNNAVPKTGGGGESSSTWPSSQPPGSSGSTYSSTP
jgi:hypothetical protein